MPTPHKRPTVLLLKEGNIHGKARAKTEPKPPNGGMEPPKYLDKLAVKYFEKYAAILTGMGICSPLYVDMLAVMANSFAAHEKAVKETHGVSIIHEGPNGPYMHPAHSGVSAAIKRILQVAPRFGLTPSDLAGLSIDNGGKLDEFEQWEKSTGKRKNKSA